VQRQPPQYRGRLASDHLKAMKDWPILNIFYKPKGGMNKNEKRNSKLKEHT